MLPPAGPTTYRGLGVWRSGLFWFHLFGTRLLRPSRKPLALASNRSLSTNANAILLAKRL